jgi:hypothetical protein
MLKKNIKESFKLFKSPNETGWEISWSKLGDDGMYVGLMFSNNSLGQSIRLDDMNDGTYIIKGWDESGAQFIKQEFQNFDSAKNFLLNYMRSNAATLSSNLKIKRLKNTLSEASERGINHEFVMLDGAVDEFVRIMNLIISNNNNAELAAKARKLRELIKQNA